jgi:mRNA-degrading endonuclease toxin of MazEF toxin-antitoxin module
MVTVRHGDGDPEDPARRRELRRLWREAEKAVRRAVLPWQIWATDPDDCALIIDNHPVPIGSTKISSNETTIEKYFRPRPAIVVSDKGLDTTAGAAWICPMCGLDDGQTAKGYPDEIAIDAESVARASRVRSVHTEWERGELLRYKRTLDRETCAVVSDTMRKLVRGQWKDDVYAPRRGTVVRHKTRNFEAVVVTSCYQAKKSMSTVLVCPRVDLRELNRTSVPTETAARAQWLYMDGNERVFDLAALQPVLARDTAVIDSVDDVTVKEIQSRILSGFARPSS